MPDSATAVGLLKGLFKKSRLGALVEQNLAKELCEITKSSDPISVLGSKLEELPGDLRLLLKELLRVFSKVGVREKEEGRWKERGRAGVREG